MEGACKMGIEIKGIFISLHSFPIPAKVCEGNSLVKPCVRVFSVDGNCAIKGNNSLIVPLQFRERDCAVVPAIRVLGPEIKGPGERIDRFPEPADREEG